MCQEFSILELALELEMAKSLTYLRQRDFAKAVETLKGFEKDTKMAATGSTNLSILYFLVSSCVTSLVIVHMLYRKET